MKYLNFTELRQKLGGRGRSTIYRDIEEGRLPKPIKFGGRLYWDDREIDRALGVESNVNEENDKSWSGQNEES